MKTKILLVILCLTVLVSCKYFKKPEVQEEPKDDFLKVPTYVTETPTETTSTSYEYDGKSYWFVMGQDPGGDIWRNGFIMQEHSYFSYQEAKEEFMKENKKDGFFITDFIKVDKETYEHNKD